MLYRLLIGFLWSVPLYFVGLFGALLLVPLLSSNTFDKSMEAAMTGVFFFGPLLAVLGFVLGALFTKPR